MRHLGELHGGRQRYRNAWLSLMQLAPCAVSGQEWRAIIANFAEFYSRSATDWEHFTPAMLAALQTTMGLLPEQRWQPRQRVGCVYCARSHWLEELYELYLAGDMCFMAKPSAVWKMLSVSPYAERWPLIGATGELEASSVTQSSLGPKNKRPWTVCRHQVFLHKRRVSDAQAAGDEAAHVCSECKCAFDGRDALALQVRSR